MKRGGVTALATAALGAVIGLAACGESGGPGVDWIVAPLFTHVTGTEGTCRGSDALVEVTTAAQQAADTNGNGHVCAKSRFRKGQDEYYDDKLSGGGGGKDFKDPPGKKKK